MIGQRGVPATFGGIERHVEEMSAGLVQLGHDVTVFSRPSYQPGFAREYRGINVRPAPTLGTKHLEAIVHSAVSTVMASARPPDIVHYHALGPGLLAPIPRFLTPSRVVLTVHGLDGDRAKWGRGAQAVLGAATWMSARVPDATVVVSKALAKHYMERYGRSTFYIPNGVSAVPPRPADEIRARWGLAERSYILFVGRLVQEKAPDLLISAFRQVQTNLRLVIAGGSSFTDSYVTQLHRMAEEDERIILPGYVYGSALEELYSNAAVFVLPSSVEGLPLTLLEAASYGVPIVASSIPPNVEVVGTDGDARLFPPGDKQALVEALSAAVREGTQEGSSSRMRLRDRVLKDYQWQPAVQRLDEIYNGLTERSNTSRLPSWMSGLTLRRATTTSGEGP